jgi:hypothetical protein
MMQPAEINSRLTYVKFRTEWRNVYKALSSEIRETRKLARTSHSIDEQSRAQHRLHWLKVKARSMMDNLEQAKAKRPIQIPEKVAA